MHKLPYFLGVPAFSRAGHSSPSPHPALDDSTWPAGLSLLFRTRTQDSEATTLLILLFHCFLFKPKLSPPRSPNTASILNDWNPMGSLCPRPTCTWEGLAFWHIPQINSTPQPKSVEGFLGEILGVYTAHLQETTLYTLPLHTYVQPPDPFPGPAWVSHSCFWFSPPSTISRLPLPLPSNPSKTKAI